ncbi:MULTISPECIES: serine hydrolase domain-containing protein [unclassified Dyella]|uniref:serine hydrolase domain-containing protein n=1 Tax=unclassified Dyella TaxID=2634549 RepID=UPI000C835F61|nr:MULTISPECIES: serine hydrolase domain-containing protein [unclassified Dyella]MDR3445465.1 serine hydrolase [Dyella sp.]PMQ05309.1 putative penicillin-binding protein PbpX [Dyella sp. AD56]
MRRRFLWWMVALAPTVVAASPDMDSALAKRIDSDAQTVLQRTDTPGATIAIYRDGKPLYVHAYGLSDRERKTPATTSTYYEIGSITKQFTAAAILQLQEAGKLDINAKLATYLPDAPHAKEVTLKQLLSHTSGMPEYLDGPDVEQWAVKPATFDQIMARIKDKPLDFQPGSRWSYSNSGYALLGRVIELTSHESYLHYVKTHLLVPAGMTHTYTVDDESRLSGMAKGYRHANGKLEPAPTIHATVGWAAGVLVSTVDDLERWNVALRGGKIIRPADYTLMATPVEGSNDYGLGLFIDTLDDQPRIGHTGGSFGFTTSNQYFPKQGIQVIAFTNVGDNPEPGQMLVTATFEALYPDIAAAARKPAAGEDAATTAAARKAFAQMQKGNEDASMFGDKLKAKMAAGLSGRLAKQLSPFGEPSSFIFKGRRQDKDKTWNDYVIEFGPGNYLQFGVELDTEGRVAGISLG